MPKAHVIITAITVQGLSYRQVAIQYGISKTWAHQLHKRWLAHGEAGLIPTSKRPHTSPRALPGLAPVWWTPRKRECSLWETDVGSSLLSSRTRP